MIERWLFSILSAGAIISAIMVVTRRNPVVSALCLIANFFFLAGLYLVLRAQFIAFIQILVYAGAIMVLFVFVIMLLNLSSKESLREAMNWKKIVPVVLGFALVMELIYIFLSHPSPPSSIAIAEAVGTVESVGKVLFTTYLFPFEITSLLLTAAIVGAILLGKKKLE